MARGRSGRSRGRRAAQRSPTPVQPEEPSDEEVQEESAPQTPQEEDNGEAEDSEPAEVEVPSERSSPPIQPIPRKRRLGRPPKNRPPDWDTPRLDDDRSDHGTPRRKRGRPAGSGRGRGRPRESMTLQVRVDKEGTMMDVVNDEVALPDDPEGEEKVDKDGNLLGGREYRVRTFTVDGREDRLYMLSTEPARCCGFRDSYLFFTKHMQLHKIIVDDEEKRDLISRDIIPHSYKGRSIGICTARSVFREFGSRIVVGGKKVVDDYYAQAARDRGDVEGELADPHDQLPPEGEPYNRNQYVAWFGASAVYHQNPVTTQLVNGKPIPSKRKVQITSANWQFEHARAASRFNSYILANRRANLTGVYDPHTNLMMYPKIMQPTHVRWDQITGQDQANNPASAAKVDVLTNGVDGVHINGSTEHIPAPPITTTFDPVSRVVSRNFLVTDTYYHSAPQAGLGLPGPDGDVLDVGTNGLPRVTDEILAELPPECRRALEEAKQQQTVWREAWGTESSSGARGKLNIRFLGFPN